MHKKLPIGILGGMGPEASVYMYKLMIELSIKHFGACDNSDFPRIVLDSLPVPDFISNEDNKSKALIMLKESVKQFNRSDILCLAIACNTAHILIDDLRKTSKAPFVSMIDEVSFLASKDNKEILGILGTPSTIKSGLYQAALEKYKIQSVVPDSKDLNILEGIIRNVLRGEISKSDSKKLLIVANSLRKKGARGIILGCTELPLVFPPKYSLPVYNSVEILSMALLRKYYK